MKSKSNNMSTITKWTCTTNHTQIGILYMLLGGFAGVVGMSLSMVIRLELAQPGNTSLGKQSIVQRWIVSVSSLYCFNKS